MTSNEALKNQNTHWSNLMQQQRFHKKQEQIIFSHHQRHLLISPQKFLTSYMRLHNHVARLRDIWPIFIGKIHLWSCDNDQPKRKLSLLSPKQFLDQKNNSDCATCMQYVFFEKQTKITIAAFKVWKHLRLSFIQQKIICKNYFISNYFSSINWHIRH